MTRRRIDWPSARRDYVEGIATNPDGDPDARTWPSLRDIATLYGVHEGTVGSRSAREHWPDLRDKHQLEIDRARRDRLTTERAERAARVDQRGLSAAEGGLTLVGHRLAFLLQRANQQPATTRAADIAARELATLALAAWRFVRVKDAVLGVPQPDELPDEATMEREQRVEEAMLAAKMAAAQAARDADERLLDGV